MTNQKFYAIFNTEVKKNEYFYFGREITMINTAALNNMRLYSEHNYALDNKHGLFVIRSYKEELPNWLH